ncbi:MAG: DUF3078 domain-containing protein [Prolixibacteraceae bacterium]|nr:DUF3078 domain-containing protein [Prolixibacteraceae bacterium]
MASVFSLAAQETKKDTVYWKKGGDFTLNFSQISFSNWVAGGHNSISGVALMNYAANYQKARVNWANLFQFGYGLQKEEGINLKKTEDKIDLSSKFGYKITETSKWYYSALLNFRSQFANGYKYPDTDNKISAFFAPAYLTFSLGADYRPNDHFSLLLAPLAAKFTFVTDENLSNAGAFGVDPGKKFRAEMGGNIKTEANFPIVKNVDGYTSLNLFSNYLHEPQNIDVNWDIRINMKINKFLSANIISNMIYYHDILIPLDETGRTGRRMQWKQLFGAGLSFKF